jgi:hypothetical protein
MTFPNEAPTKGKAKRHLLWEQVSSKALYAHDVQKKMNSQLKITTLDEHSSKCGTK